MTSEALRDPITDHLFTRENAALAVIDISSLISTGSAPTSRMTHWLADPGRAGSGRPASPVASTRLHPPEALDFPPLDRCARRRTAGRLPGWQSGYDEDARPANRARRPPKNARVKRLEVGAVSELQGVARIKLHEGKLEEFKRVAAQCLEIVRTKDTGTLQYDVYFNDDQSECIVLERYRNSEALIEHAAHLGDLNEAIVATDWSPASSSVSRPQSSEPRWPTARFGSSRPTSRCRHPSPAATRFPSRKSASPHTRSSRACQAGSRIAGAACSTSVRAWRHDPPLHGGLCGYHPALDRPARRPRFAP
jgi:quinol monooxygenase YgiN